MPYVYIHTHTHAIRIYIYVYVYVCVCIPVCACQLACLHMRARTPLVWPPEQQQDPQDPDTAIQVQRKSLNYMDCLFNFSGLVLLVWYNLPLADNPLM